MLTLRELVTPAGLAPFRAAFAAKTRWHFPLARAAQAGAMLPWPLIDGLIGGRQVPVDLFRVVVNGHELPDSMYSDEAGRLKADAVQGHAAQGASLVINDLGSLLPDLGELMATLERELRCRAQANCYITFGAKSAFIPHHDSHDVLILQVHGAKRWASYGTPSAYPLQGGRPPVSAPQWEGLMTPGDLLYLPRGEVHAAVPETRPSVHLTLGFTEATGVDFLGWLAGKARQVEALRQDLGATLVGADRTLRDQALQQALRQLLDQATVADFFADQDSERPPRSLVALSACEVDRFAPETVLVSALRRRADLSVEVAEEVVVTLGKRQVRLAQWPRRLLAAITAHHRITVAALADRLGVAPGDPDLKAGLQALVDKAMIGLR